MSLIRDQSPQLPESNAISRPSFIWDLMVISVMTLLLSDFTQTVSDYGLVLSLLEYLTWKYYACKKCNLYTCSEIIFPSTYFLTNFNHWFGFRFLSFLHFLVNFWSGILFKRWSSRLVGMLPPKFPSSFGVFRYINSATSMPRPFAEKWSFIVIAVLINVVGSGSAI